MISKLGISGVGRGLWIKRNWIWRYVTFIVLLYGGSAYLSQSVVKREWKEEGSKRGKTENKKKWWEKGWSERNEAMAELYKARRTRVPFPDPSAAFSASLP